MKEKGILNDNNYIVSDGVLSIHELFSKEIPKNILFFDILFCPGGCLGGPGIKSTLSTEEKTKIVEEYRTKTSQEDNKSISNIQIKLDKEIDLSPCFLWITKIN